MLAGPEDIELVVTRIRVVRIDLALCRLACHETIELRLLLMQLHLSLHIKDHLGRHLGVAGDKAGSHLVHGIVLRNTTLPYLQGF